MAEKPRNVKPKATDSRKPSVPKDCNFRRYFRHYITGVVYDAWDYGHWAWPIGRKRKA